MKLKERFKQWLDTNPRLQIREVQLEVIADEFAIGFSKWCRENYIKYTVLGNVKSYKELLEIYKTEKAL